MAKRESILRNIQIIEMLRNKKQASFDEISDYLDKARDIHGDDLSISKRTFQRDLNEIRSLFYIDIQCNKVHNYYIKEDDETGFVSKLMENFNVFNAFTTAEKLYPYVILETRRALGSEHIFGLLHAIRNRFIINFTYTKYWEDEPKKRRAEPYALKEFKGRWYLLANEPHPDPLLKTGEGKSGGLKTFGLDRISELEITKTKFKYPQELNVKTMFRDCFGIYNPENKEPEEVILSFDAEQGKYVKSYPLHHSQKVLKDNDDELHISLNLKITYDFIQELAWNLDTFRVIKPVSLKKELCRIYKNAIERNK